MIINNDDLEFLQELLTEKIEVEKYFKLRNLINKLSTQKELQEKEKKMIDDLVIQLKDNPKEIIKSIVKQYKAKHFLTAKQIQTLKNEIIWIGAV